MVAGQNLGNKQLTIAFQGERGSFSHMALEGLYGKYMRVLPCETFSDALDAVRNGNAHRAIIPDFNVIKGRPSEFANLLREYTDTSNGHDKLHLTDEFCQAVHMRAVMHMRGQFELATTAISHKVALEQIRNWLALHLNITPEEFFDTAAAAKFLSETKDPLIQKTYVAICPPFASEIYPYLKVIENNVEDKQGNMTHFYVFSRTANKQAALQDSGANIISVFMLKAGRTTTEDYDIRTILRANGVYYSPLQEYKGENLESSHFLFEMAGHSGNKQIKAALKQLRKERIITNSTLVGMHASQSDNIFNRRGWR